MNCIQSPFKSQILRPDLSSCCFMQAFICKSNRHKLENLINVRLINFPQMKSPQISRYNNHSHSYFFCPLQDLSAAKPKTSPNNANDRFIDST